MQPIEQANPSPFAEQAEAWREAIVTFAQELVRTPSPSGDEKALADRLTAKMQELGYDEVFTDAIGNVVGRMRGAGTGPSALFVSHMDDVEAGDRALWQHDPLGGQIADGFLHGLGAADHKGALAAMIYAGALIRKAGVQLRGDYLVAATVHQNTRASIGMRYLVDKTMPERGIHFDLVVLGDPTRLDVFLGHRGRIEIEVVTVGRTSHAGAPWLGANAVYKMMPVIEAIQQLGTTLPSHPFLEKSTLALTDIEAAPGTPNAVPDRCTIALDRRFLPSESSDEVVWQVQSIINRLAAGESEFIGEVRVKQATEVSYTGERQTVGKLMHPFVTDQTHALVKDAVDALEAVGQAPRFGKWTFTTDGGYTSAIKKVITLGYAPGDEKFAQTPFDRVPIDQMIQAAAGYAAISARVSG